MAEANAAGSTTLPALSPRGDSNPPASSTTPAPIDRAAIMRRAHKIARRFVGILANYRACIAHGMRCAWADAKARQEHRQRFAGFVPQALTARQIAESRYFARRVGSSFT
jgi:hypothetical protein